MLKALCIEDDSVTASEITAELRLGGFAVD
jgi:hypothetical protein